MCVVTQAGLVGGGRAGADPQPPSSHISPPRQREAQSASALLSYSIASQVSSHFLTGGLDNKASRWEKYAYATELETRSDDTRQLV
ncbi:hypothetical protein J6590_018144 [Homalodisca vitripennis]|nr:hypothetical protein J6590_018144 [Homalodisca vitripennis]